MRHGRTGSAFAAVLTALLAGLAFGSEGVGEKPSWPQFRGEGALGISDAHEAALHFDALKGEGLRFRVFVPGLAHSSPIVAGDRVFLTTAEGADEAALKVGLYGAGDSVEGEGEQAFSLLCFDRRSGELLWEEVVFEGEPAVKRHPKGTHANATPVTDGQNVVACFASEGLHCYDVEGTKKWSKDLGTVDCGAPGMRHYQWGYASSPVLHDGKLLVLCDDQDQSFLLCLDVETGEELWRTNRDEPPTWGSPAVVPVGDAWQVVVNGYVHRGGYSFADGSEIWRSAGGGDVPVPTPIFVDGLVYFSSAHGREAPIFAMDLARAQGEVSLDPPSESVVWIDPRRGNYMQTPLVYRGVVYCCNDNGRFSQFDAKTGELLAQSRLGDGSTGFSASGVAVAGRLYFSSETGQVHVLEASREAAKELAVNDLGETCMATPAVVDGELYFRTRSHLVCVARPEAESP